jgi:hypothetical protein
MKRRRPKPKMLLLSERSDRSLARVHAAMTWVDAEWPATAFGRERRAEELLAILRRMR